MFVWVVGCYGVLDMCDIGVPLNVPLHLPSVLLLVLGDTRHNVVVIGHSAFWPTTCLATFMVLTTCLSTIWSWRPLFYSIIKYCTWYNIKKSNNACSSKPVELSRLSGTVRPGQPSVYFYGLGVRYFTLYNIKKSDNACSSKPVHLLSWYP